MTGLHYYQPLVFLWRREVVSTVDVHGMVTHLYKLAPPPIFTVELGLIPVPGMKEFSG